MSRVGSKVNIQTPDAKCMKCKRWVKASNTRGVILSIPGHCSLGYCEKDRFKKKGSTFA